MWGQDKAMEQTRAIQHYSTEVSFRPPGSVSHNILYVTEPTEFHLICYEPSSRGCLGVVWPVLSLCCQWPASVLLQVSHLYWLNTFTAVMLFHQRSCTSFTYPSLHMAVRGITLSSSRLRPTALISPPSFILAIWSTQWHTEKVLRWQLWSFAQSSMLYRLKGASPSLPLS